MVKIYVEASHDKNFILSHDISNAILANEEAASVLDCFHVAPPNPSKWNLEMLVFSVPCRKENRRTRRKTLRASWEPTRNLTHIWHRTRIKSAGLHWLAWVSSFSYIFLPSCWERPDTRVNIGRRQTLSSLRHLCSFRFSVMWHCGDQKSKSVFSTGVHITVIIRWIRIYIKQWKTKFSRTLTPLFW